MNPEYEMIGDLIQGKQTKPEEMSQLHESLRNKMVAAQLRHKGYYDLHRKPDLNLLSGDMVCLLPRTIKTTGPSKKLDYKKIRPFKILAKIGTSTYKLAFAPSMAIHNTFPISLLEPYQDNLFPSHIKEPSPPIQIEGEDEYELDEKSLTLDSYTTSSNIELGGKAIHQNTIKSGTPQKTSTMKDTQSNDATGATQESPECLHVTINRSSSAPPPVIKQEPHSHRP